MKIAWVVFRKELTELIRDRRTLWMTILLPILTIPALILFIDSQQNSLAESQKEAISVAVAKNTDLSFQSRLKEIPNLKIKPVSNPEETLREGEVRLFLEEEKGGQISIWANPGDTKSMMAFETLGQQLDQINQNTYEQKYGNQIPPDTLFQWELKEIEAKDNKNVQTLFFLIAMLLIMIPLTGGMPAAIDAVAGEKERGTLFPLNMVPVPSHKLLTGKLLTVFILGFVSTLLAIVSMGVAYSRVNPEIAESLRAIFFSANAAFWMVLCLLHILLLAVLELIVSTFAKSFKEANSYFTPLFFGALVPVYVLMGTMPYELNMTHFLLPIVSFTASLKELLAGQVVMPHLAGAITSTLIYVVIGIGFMNHFYKQQRI